MRDLSVNRRQPVLLLPKAAALLIYSEAITSHCLGCGVVTFAHVFVQSRTSPSEGNFMQGQEAKGLSVPKHRDSAAIRRGWGSRTSSCLVTMSLETFLNLLCEPRHRNRAGCT